jgi:hypothetical protein
LLYLARLADRSTFLVVESMLQQSSYLFGKLW